MGPERTVEILTINLGSTSTKIGFFQNQRMVLIEEVEHPEDLLTRYRKTWDQLEIRRVAVEEFLAKHLADRETLDVVVGRGGLFKPVPGGVYAVNEQMIKDAIAGYQGQHPSNLGCALAREVAEKYSARPLIVDPVSTDEMEAIARISGHPRIQRRSLSHALNIHYVARQSAQSLGKPISETRFVVAHLGGGTSVAPVLGGRIIDVNDANNEGPFSATRAGTVPSVTLANWIIEAGFSREQVREELLKKSGLRGYLGTTDGREIEERIQSGDAMATFILRAMAYQIAKEIAAMSSVLEGDVHRIILTGGLARCQSLMDSVESRVRWIAPVRVLPGDYEMQAMAEGVMRVYSGEEEVLRYPGGKGR
ncbi:MAG: butyrate kinase [Calditrichota bacterium]